MARRHRPLFPLLLRWPGATARYSHFRVPVETGTPPRRRKVRSAPFPPSGENCARSLAPPLQIEPACAGLRFGWRLRRRMRENFLQSPLSSVSAWRRKLRPLPCSYSPNRTRLRWASIWLAASPPHAGEFFAKSARLRFRLAAKTAPAPLLLLSKSNPLALGFDLVGGFAAACGRIFCKVRSAPFPPSGENYARSLAPPLQIEPACAGLRFGWRLRRRLGENRPGLGK